VSTRRKHPRKPWPKDKLILPTRPGDPMRGLTPTEIADSARGSVYQTLTQSDWGRWRITKQALLRLWWGH
jgi:hypothetical protein